MATKQVTSTSTHNGDSGDGGSDAQRLLRLLTPLGDDARTAVKNRFKIGTHAHYAAKARGYLTELRREFLLVKAEYPLDREPAVAAELDLFEKALTSLERGLMLPPREFLEIVDNAAFRLGSHLDAALHASNNYHNGSVPFITLDILPNGVFRKVLEEANRCFVQDCPNACAAMLRRLVESLIIEAFEANNIGAQIKDSTGEYLELKALIGKATAEPKLKLSRSTKNALPNLKVLGDLSVHGRRHLVRNDDLEKIQKDARIALEELAFFLK
jgi:hypothetical protein